VIGPDFERFGGLFLDHLLSTPLEHSGLTVLGFPISRACLIAAAPMARIVAEDSADYFTRGCSRPRRT
jgi:hypothetical protein